MVKYFRLEGTKIKFVYSLLFPLDQVSSGKQTENITLHHLDVLFKFSLIDKDHLRAYTILASISECFGGTFGNFTEGWNL